MIRASQQTALICALCITSQTLIASSSNLGITQSTNTNDETNDKETYRGSSSASESSESISSEIRSLIGKTLDFSYLSSFTDGVQLTLDKKPVDFSAFIVDESNAKILSKMLRGRNMTELFYVASKLAGIEARAASLENELVTSLAMEDVFALDYDMVVKSRDVDEMEREITEDPNLLDLDHTSESVSPDRTKRKATVSRFYWPPIIPYKISSDFDDDASYTRAIRDGIQNWADETCLEFRELSKDNDYGDSHIIFRNLDGCYSNLGRVFGNGQVISVDRNGNCGTKGIVAHEIGHALGFYHEQSRPDRDLYVKILTENIDPADRFAFIKSGWHKSVTAGIPYDYSSVMHYPLNFFSRNGENTMSVLEDDMDKVVGSQHHLSFFDVKIANYIYCPDRCSEGLAWSACQNDGYRDPKDCSRCRCPDGWTGRYCTYVKPGVNAACGSTELLATSTWQTLKSPYYDTNGYPANSECTWRIKAPLSNQRIVLKFVGRFAIPPCKSSCQDYIEVRNKDMARTGPRYCCDSPTSKEIVSHGNQVLLLMRTSSGLNNKGFHLEYTMEACGCSINDSVNSAPACLETQSVQCNGIYRDCSSGLCVKKYRNNTCYKETEECCGGFELQGNFCYRPWSAWLSWSSCSKTCGTGNRRRTRTCIKHPCSGSSIETQTCNSNTCPDSWSNWNAWNSCSKTCGSGYQYRIRSCSGSSCSGSVFESRTCNNNSCSGQWNNWNAWSGCSKTCGSGSQSRSRVCLSTTCSGSTSESQTCSTNICPGVWTSWYTWSTCTKSCGSGTQTRNRACQTSPCSGSTSDSQTCNTNTCPGVWTNWNAWSSCSMSCGSGTQTRNRACLIPPCSGSISESQTCNTNICPGQWSNWYAWKSCSNTCGSGSRTRSRSCSGMNCSGPTAETQTCNDNECANSGVWSDWNPWSSCSRSCGIGYRLRSRSCLTDPCSGHTFQALTCSSSSCSVSNSWSGWGEWSNCSKSCGYGNKTRRRTCDGRGCSGVVAETDFCNTDPCPESARCTYIARCDELPGRARYCTRYRAC